MRIIKTVNKPRDLFVFIDFLFNERFMKHHSRKIIFWFTSRSDAKLYKDYRK